MSTQTNEIVYYVRRFQTNGEFRTHTIASVLHTDPECGFLKSEPVTISGSCIEGMKICQRCEGKWKGRYKGKISYTGGNN